MTEVEFRRFVDAAKALEACPLFIDDTPALPISQLAARARRLKRTHGLDVLIVDYLQLVRGTGKSDNRVNEISEITMGLKAIAKELDIPAVGIYDHMGYVEEKMGIKTVGFNKGGTVQLGKVAVTMVTASHSSTYNTEDGPMYAGTESGFMIAGEGKVIYFSGDTDVMMDMELFEDLHHPDIGILSAGGHFTMDMTRAAYAARRFFNFKMVIPCHYNTFPVLEQSVQPMIDAVPGAQVIEPEVLVPIEA